LPLKRRKPRAADVFRSREVGLEITEAQRIMRRIPLNEVLKRRTVWVLLSLCLLMIPWWGCQTIPSSGEIQAVESARQRKESAVARMEESPQAVQPIAGPSGPYAGPEILTGEPPQWVSISPGSDDQYHYGVGKAYLSDEDFGNLARERALADLAAKIVVTVRKDTTDYASLKVKGKRSVSEQEIEETIRTSTDARLRNPELVTHYRSEDSYHVLMRVSALSPLQKELKSWSGTLMLADLSIGEFLDSRGVRTGFGDYLKDLVTSQRSGAGNIVGESSVPVVSGHYRTLSDDISITLKVQNRDGTVLNQRTFQVPAEPDYLVMMVNRRDHSLVNAVPTARWGGGNLSLGKEVFREGDEINIRFSSTVDSYVTVFNIIEDGTVTMLLPNRFRKDTFVKAGTSLVFPMALERQRGLVMRAHLPSDKVSTRESVKVVATQRPVDLARGDFSEAVLEDYNPDSEGIRRLLATLEDLDDRGVPWFEEVQYFVIRAK
jgi:hypothetical protein